MHTNFANEAERFIATTNPDRVYVNKIHDFESKRKDQHLKIEVMDAKQRPRAKSRGGMKHYLRFPIRSGRWSKQGFADFLVVVAAKHVYYGPVDKIAKFLNSHRTATRNWRSFERRVYEQIVSHNRLFELGLLTRIPKSAAPFLGDHLHAAYNARNAIKRVR